MSNQRVSSVLRPKYLRKKSPKNGSLSWFGHEEKLAKIRALAEAYKKSDSDLETACHNSAWSPMNATVTAMKRPQAIQLREAHLAADSQNALVAYHKYLVLDVGLNHHLVRKEWSLILNPHPAEASLCENNLRLERLQ